PIHLPLPQRATLGRSLRVPGSFDRRHPHSIQEDPSMTEPAPSLDGPRLKLARAAHHLEALVREVALVREGGYELRMERDPDTTGYRPRLRFTERPPVKIPLLIGDLAHNARARLDHLPHQLVRATRGTPKVGPGGAQFPVLNAPLAEGRTLRIAGGVHADALTAIEKVQPKFGSHPGDTPGARVASPLWLLNELSNIDKHRFHVVHRMLVGNMRGEIVFGDEALGEFEIDGHLEEGATPNTSSYFSTETGEPPNVYMNGQGTVDVSLKVPMPPPLSRLLVPTISGLTAFVGQDVLPRFERFFV
ncbi:MAG: hypothetical protein LC792_19085, partial [Actinobacteria bacterium]|nr:hypothetical protein [Actinomycetota bacterium]